jgi:hypothetical protein
MVSIRQGGKRSERDKGKRGAQENAHAALYRLAEIPSGLRLRYGNVAAANAERMRTVVRLRCRHAQLLRSQSFFDDRSTFIQQFIKKMSHSLQTIIQRNAVKKLQI